MSQKHVFFLSLSGFGSWLFIYWFLRMWPKFKNDMFKCPQKIQSCQFGFMNLLNLYLMQPAFSSFAGFHHFEAFKKLKLRRSERTFDHRLQLFSANAACFHFLKKSTNAVTTWISSAFRKSGVRFYFQTVVTFFSMTRRELSIILFSGSAWKKKKKKPQ